MLVEILARQTNGKELVNSHVMKQLLCFKDLSLG